MLLALDTSTLTLSMALLDETGGEPRVVEHLLIGPPRKVSEMLPGELGELLQRHGVKLPDLRAMVFGLGPGSFTGLRIGLSTLKALGYASNVPLMGVSSLAAVALEGPPDRTLLPIAVARTQELYVGQYRRTSQAPDEVALLAPEDAGHPSEIAALCSRLEGSVLLGPAVGEYRAQLESLGVPAERLLEVAQVPSSVALGTLALRMGLPERYDAQAVFSLEPHYVRASEAERNPKFPPLPGLLPAARLKED